MVLPSRLSPPRTITVREHLTYTECCKVSHVEAQHEIGAAFLSTNGVTLNFMEQFGQRPIEVQWVAPEPRYTVLNAHA